MGQLATPSVSAPSLAHGRLCIVLAAVLWSLSGGFSKLLTQDTSLELNQPAISPLQIAFFRVLFAGLVLVPTLRRRELTFRRGMVLAAVCFASMNALYLSAMTLGSAANAALLQYTAPMWMYLASVWWLGEPADWRSSVAMGVGFLGVAVIVGGGWTPEQFHVILLGLGSGVGYAGVMVCLRVLRDVSSRWLTVWNHLCGALVLLPLVAALGWPSWPQMSVLFVFGALQMGLPYWLVARGLRSVSPQEAGAITLLEPMLVPVWAYLVSPQTETPHPATFVGGAMILGGLAWRYWPRKQPGAAT